MKTIKVILLVVVMLAGLSFSAAAQQGSKSLKPMSPRAVVVSLYKQHKKRSPFFQTRSRALLDKYFARELADLIWQDARSSGGEVGALDGDPLFNAQDMKITNFLVHEGTVGTEMADVLVSFENLGQKQQITFKLVQSRTGWKVANIEYDDGTSLLKILRPSPKLFVRTILWGCEPRYFFQQLVKEARLFQVVVAAGHDCQFPGALCRTPGIHQYRQTLKFGLATNLPSRFKSVHHRHQIVHEDQSRTLANCRLDPLLSIFSLDNSVP